jgi:hypothetical protein
MNCPSSLINNNYPIKWYSMCYMRDNFPNGGIKRMAHTLSPN